MTVVISGTFETVSPLAISMPVAEGVQSNRFDDFPVMTRGVDADGGRLQTGYLPATTIRGFLRRAVVLDLMKKAAESGKPYTLQRAYADLIGQDADSESKESDIDLIRLKELRDAEPVLDLFGSGLGVKSRLLVSHFLPNQNVLPEVFTGVRKDLGDTEGILESISEADRESYLGRAGANSRRADALQVVTKLKRDLRKAEKAGEDTAALAAALKEAEAVVERHRQDMGTMTNSSRTLTSYYALPAGIELRGRLVIDNERDRDLPMIELALDALSRRPILGAQSARGCGEIAGSFEVRRGDQLLKKITIGGFAPARIVDFSTAGNGRTAA